MEDAFIFVDAYLLGIGKRKNDVVIVKKETYQP
jgi:hypothetical protein